MFEKKVMNESRIKILKNFWAESRIFFLFFALMMIRNITSSSSYLPLCFCVFWVVYKCVLLLLFQLEQQMKKKYKVKFQGLMNQLTKLKSTTTTTICKFFVNKKISLKKIFYKKKFLSSPHHHQIRLVIFSKKVSWKENFTYEKKMFVSGNIFFYIKNSYFLQCFSDEKNNFSIFKIQLF